MSVIDLLVTLAIYGLVWYILWWAQGKIALPEPFGKVLSVVLVIAAVADWASGWSSAAHPFAFVSRATAFNWFLALIAAALTIFILIVCSGCKACPPYHWNHMSGI